MNEAERIALKKDEILFLADEMENDVYLIESGKVMVFVQKGSQIIPVAYLSKGEYIGELSFFDNDARSASIICVEDSEFLVIKTAELNAHLPDWLRTMGLQITKKIREGDELIRSKGIRKNNLGSIKPLTIEEQTRCFKLVDLHKSKNK